VTQGQVGKVTLSALEPEARLVLRYRW